MIYLDRCFLQKHQYDCLEFRDPLQLRRRCRQTHRNSGRWYTLLHLNSVAGRDIYYKLLDSFIEDRLYTGCIKQNLFHELLILITCFRYVCPIVAVIEQVLNYTVRNMILIPVSL